MTKPLYFWNGSSFELVGPTTPQSPFAYQTSAPTAPATGDIWIDSDGDVDTYNRQLTRYYFVASAGQTSVSGTDANGLTLAYVAGSEQVYVNGALQVRGVDYTATNGTSITGLSALALNDVVEVFAYTAFTVANAYTKSETDSVAAAAAGLRMVVPSSVAVGSGTGSVDAIGNVTFTSASSVSINGCFDATYDNYVIMIHCVPTGTGNSTLRLRVSGSDNSSSNYRYYIADPNSSSNTFSTLAVNTGTEFRVGTNRNGNGDNSIVYLFQPFTAKHTQYKTDNTNFDGTNAGVLTGWGSMTVTTSYTGFTFIPTASSTGVIRIYGYKD